LFGRLSVVQTLSLALKAQAKHFHQNFHCG
jgi:hypothetical protein